MKQDDEDEAELRRFSSALGESRGGGQEDQPPIQRTKRKSFPPKSATPRPNAPELADIPELLSKSLPSDLFKSEYEMQHPDQYERLHPANLVRVNRKVSDVEKKKKKKKTKKKKK